ncbi:hypothetical protein [Clostridium minihomine]|uniref:hypothetical protein n=1 Tax=Clostridium minihomine TaxID=2045012 RepID=UPI0013EC8AC2|nr:hypothetical protein [Clostridium minihomine]
MKGEKATFVIKVLYRSGSTWQGTLRWVDGNKEQNFRSELELLHLMNSALDLSEPEDNL